MRIRDKQRNEEGSDSCDEFDVHSADGAGTCALLDTDDGSGEINLPTRNLGPDRAEQETSALSASCRDSSPLEAESCDDGVASDDDGVSDDGAVGNSNGTADDGSVGDSDVVAGNCIAGNCGDMAGNGMIGDGKGAADDGVAGDIGGAADEGVTGDSGYTAGDFAADASEDPGTDAAPVDDESLTEDDTTGLHALKGRRVLVDLADEGAHLGRIQAPQEPNVFGGAWHFPVVFDHKVTDIFDFSVIKGSLLPRGWRQYNEYFER
jgi:hypothetical protein